MKKSLCTSRVPADYGLLSCWECGSTKVTVIERFCNYNPGLMTDVKFRFTARCRDCGNETCCQVSAEDAVKAWNQAYNRKESD